VVLIRAVLCRPRPMSELLSQIPRGLRRDLAPVRDSILSGRAPFLGSAILQPSPSPLALPFSAVYSSGRGRPPPKQCMASSPSATAIPSTTSFSRSRPSLPFLHSLTARPPCTPVSSLISSVLFFSNSRGGAAQSFLGGVCLGRSGLTSSLSGTDGFV